MAWDSNNKTCPCIKTPYAISIFTAATYGDCSSLSKKLSLYPLNSLPQTDDSGYSPLHFAAQFDRADCLGLLLDRFSGSRPGGVVVADFNESGCTPLHRAAFSGALSCVKMLVEAGADVLKNDASFPGEGNAFHKSVKGGRWLVLGWLFEHVMATGGTEALGEVFSSEDEKGRSLVQFTAEQCSQSSEEQSGSDRFEGIAGGKGDASKCKAVVDKYLEVCLGEARFEDISVAKKALAKKALPKKALAKKEKKEEDELCEENCDCLGTGTGRGGSTRTWERRFGAIFGFDTD